MAQQLRKVTINMKALDQKIDNHIIATPGDAQGRSLQIIFTQKAAAQFTPSTKVYLSWRHIEQDIRGLNIFKHIDTTPQTWEIIYPSSMLLEGNVSCCIQLIDEVSIVQSSTFLVHVLKNIDDGAHFIPSDDYSEFQKAVIDLNSTKDQILSQTEDQKQVFDNMTKDFTTIKQQSAEAVLKSNEAYKKAEDALTNINQKNTATGITIIEY